MAASAMAANDILFQLTVNGALEYRWLMVQSDCQASSVIRVFSSHAKRPKSESRASLGEGCPKKQVQVISETDMRISKVHCLMLVQGIS